MVNYIYIGCMVVCAGLVGLTVNLQASADHCQTAAIEASKGVMLGIKGEALEALNSKSKAACDVAMAQASVITRLTR